MNDGKPLTKKGQARLVGNQPFTIGGKPHKKERQRRELETLALAMHHCGNCDKLMADEDRGCPSCGWPWEEEEPRHGTRDV